MKVKPGNQVKYNQGTYMPVRMILSDKDAAIARYGAIRGKLYSSKRGPQITKEQIEEMHAIPGKLGMTEEAVRARAQELKDIAKAARNMDEEVVVDVTKMEMEKAAAKAPIDADAVRKMAERGEISEVTLHADKNPIRPQDFERRLSELEKFGITRDDFKLLGDEYALTEA